MSEDDHDEHDDDEHVSASGRPMSFLAAAAWTIGIGLSARIAVEVTAGARPGAEDDLVNLTACYVLACSALLFGMLRLYSPHASLRDVLGMRATSPSGVLLSIAGGVVLYPALDLIDTYVTKRFPPSAEETERVGRLMQATTIGQRVVLLVSLMVVFPFFEEIFFRGGLFRGLRRARPEGLAVIASAAFYAMSHGDPRVLATTFILGLFTAWLRGRSGSVLPSIAANVAYNAVPLLPIALGKGDVNLGPKVAIAGAIAAAVFAWGAGMIFASDLRAERGRLLDA
jgi:hypothetical protein